MSNISSRWESTKLYYVAKAVSGQLDISGLIRQSLCSLSSPSAKWQLSKYSTLQVLRSVSEKRLYKCSVNSAGIWLYISIKLTFMTSGRLCLNVCLLNIKKDIIIQTNGTFQCVYEIFFTKTVLDYKKDRGVSLGVFFDTGSLEESQGFFCVGQYLLCCGL